MTGKDIKTSSTDRYSSIKFFLRIFAVIILTAVFIGATGLVVGSFVMTGSIERTMEENMLVTVDIADLYVSREIMLIKIEAAEAASMIERLLEDDDSEGALEYALASFTRNHSKMSDPRNLYVTINDQIISISDGYLGFALYTQDGLYDYAGIEPVPELHREGFMQRAFNGSQSISTTMRTGNDTLVMYVSAPVGDGMVLAAAMDGLYLSQLLATFEFWHGHLVIDDNEGTILVNSRPGWVEERRNFIAMSQNNPEYEGVASVVTRGIAGERDIAQFSISDVPRIASFRPLSGSEEGWFIMIVMPLDQTVLYEIPEGIMLIAAIMFAMSIVAAVIASINLKRPYEKADHLYREAEISSLSKSTFLANMSHEIRTPMNSIIGFSELALDNELPEKTRDYLTKIHSNAEWLLVIINDILDISKIESGKLELESIPFNMSDLFSSCRTLILPKAIEKGLTLYIYAEPSVNKEPLGDPTRLRQVFVNLLSNAVKFTQTGIIKLNAVLKHTDSDSITMMFEVRDSGIGMTPDQISKIFDPFVQGETGTTRNYGGTGLGLTITRNIIELMGGKLMVESAPGVGSKFSFEMKFKTRDINTGVPTIKQSLIELKKPTFDGEVLVCEDNAMNQQVICEHLLRVGLRPVVAENGKVGVEAVKKRMESGKKPFDIVFMDMHMPVMDGLEAADKILELKIGMPIVAMTANIMIDDMEIYKDHGMKDCVGKPFTSTELWLCLLKYLTPIDTHPADEARLEQMDAELHNRLVIHFVNDNQKKAGEIKESIQAGDLKVAHRLAHTLKSNAGQLGKMLLQRAAEAVEYALKDEVNNTTPEQLETLELELSAALVDFAPAYENAMKQKSEEPPVTPIDKESALEALDKLKELLQKGSPECRTYIGELRRMEGSEEIIKQIDDFDYTQAITSVEELKAKIEAE
jgi:signal transduction histidine kinase/CheY-like chemotaxis protein